MLISRRLLAASVSSTRRTIVKGTVAVASTKRMSSTTEKSWTASIKVAEMKQVLKAVPEAAHCVERSELETLVSRRFSSLDDFQAALNAQQANEEHEATRIKPLLARVQQVLSQDRQTLNFEHYTTSDEHKQRLQELATVAPELYDNSSITPRSKWFQHPRYRQNSQMPPFHVHFRYELQDVVRYVYEAYSASDARRQSQALQKAHSLFQRSMRGLNGHVSIEEYACFPIYKDLYPHMDLQFLYADHQHLHATEQHVERTLRGLLKQSSQQPSGASIIMIPREELVSVLETVLDFDDMLMTHLGEEEEIVVPMSLTDKDFFF